jgi:glycosyltransferase involved in cell wall biosynthesis
VITPSTVSPRSATDGRRPAVARLHWITRVARGQVLVLGTAQPITAMLEARVGPHVVHADTGTHSGAGIKDLPGACVDSVVLLDILQPGSDGRRILTEAVRVIRPDGMLFVTVRLPRPGENGTAAFDPATLLDLLGPSVEVASADVAGEDFRVTARPGFTPVAALRRLGADLQTAFETALVAAPGAGTPGLSQRLSHLRRQGRVLWYLARHPGHLTATVAPRSPLPVDLPPPAALPDGPVARPHVTAAVVLDEVSSIGFGYEWNQVPLVLADWQDTVERVHPDLLFVESVGRGDAGRRHPLVLNSGGPTEELRELVVWCREHHVPTVFWDKEGPADFDRHLECARLFDHVFTADADRIPRYRERLGHANVDLLPFAAQPRVHNPVSVPRGRRLPVAFAGTYQASGAQLDAVVAPARAFGLHVLGRADGGRGRQLPSEYVGQVVGSLPYEDMLAAYKAYKVFVNVDTVTRSPTMCARQVFELSACSTPVVSGYSRALEDLFAGLVVLSRTESDTRRALAVLLADDDRRDRLGHLAMREVLARHTYGHRVDTVLRALGLPAATARPARPKVSVILPTSRPGHVGHALEQAAGQTYRPLQVVVVLRGVDLAPQVVEDKARDAGLDDVVVVTAGARMPSGACLNLGLDAADGDLVARMDDQSSYGAHYLADLVAAFSYTDARAVGKGAHYVRDELTGRVDLRFAHLEHTIASVVHPSTLVIDGGLIRRLRFADVHRGAETDLVQRVRNEGAGVYSADRFNFIGVRRSADGPGGAAEEPVTAIRGRGSVGTPDHRIVF